MVKRAFLTALGLGAIASICIIFGFRAKPKPLAYEVSNFQLKELVIDGKRYDVDPKNAIDLVEAVQHEIMAIIAAARGHSVKSTVTLSVETMHFDGLLIHDSHICKNRSKKDGLFEIRSTFEIPPRDPRDAILEGTHLVLHTNRQYYVAIPVRIVPRISH